MSKKLFPVLLLLLIPAVYSCRTSKKLNSSSVKSQSVPVTQSARDYINAYKDIAVSEMRRTGIPASITLAQGMVESDFGRSLLARDANNHFGIKCHTDWTGPTITQDDDTKGECFRKYLSAENSFYDHSEFLRTRPRYSFLFDIAPGDYKAWAHGLKKAGYATNPDYPNMLIRKIEENNLTSYDNFDLTGKAAAKQQSPAPLPAGSSANVPVEIKPTATEGPSPATIETAKSPVTKETQVNTSIAVYAKAPRIRENNKIQYIIVKDNDTRDGIEQEFSLLGWELPRYNDLKPGFELIPGEILYIQPKKEKAEQGVEYHVVNEGDTMYSISQKYGIKLKSLYSMNRMSEDEKAETGRKIWLRSTKPND